VSTRHIPISEDTEPINDAVRAFETDGARDWKHQEMARRLYRFYDIFNDVFFDAQPLPQGVISFEHERRSRLGHYKIGRNGLGLTHNINLNPRHIAAHPARKTYRSSRTGWRPWKHSGLRSRAG